MEGGGEEVPIELAKITKNRLILHDFHNLGWGGGLQLPKPPPGYTFDANSYCLILFEIH